jgi:hypothetical protein
VVIGDVRLRVGGINCVGTLPEYRRHGLGSQIMEAAQQTMQRLGCHVGLLSTGITNWYRRLGWEEGGTQRGYRLNRGNIRLLPSLRATLRFQVVELGAQEDQPEGIMPEMAAALMRLYHAQGLGGERSVERFRQLLIARRVARAVVAADEEGPVAYLLVSENVVHEWAGAAEDIAGLARTYFEIMDNPAASTSERGIDGAPLVLRTLVLQTPSWPHALVQLLDARRIPYHNDYLGMLYVVDPQTILDAYGLTSVHVEAYKADAGNTFVLHEGLHTVRLDRRQLTKLFFGPERIGELAAENFPLPFWQWGLEKV